MIKNAAEARELTKQYPDIPDRDDELQYREAIGYLSGMEDPAVKGLVEALGRLKDGHETCQKCEGDGRLWADGKAHYSTYQGKTIPCSHCAGNGETVADSREIASNALAHYRESLGHHQPRGE